MAVTVVPGLRDGLPGRKTSAKITRLGFPVIVVCLIGIIVWNVWPASRPYTGEDLITAGDTIRDLAAKDISTGELISFHKTPFTFILYFNNENIRNPQKALYAAYLAKANTEMQFVVIIGGHYRDIENMHNSRELPIPVTNDSSYAISKELHLSKKYDGSFVLDQSGKILFSAPFGVAPEDMRELYERYTFGKITYEDVSAVHLQQVGARFPDLFVREVGSGKRRDLKALSASGPMIYWLFSADCPVCSLSGSLAKLADPKVPQNVIPLFSSRFPLVVLENSIQKAHIAKPVYVAESEITGFESLYYSHSQSSATSFLVRVDSGGLITRIDPIGTFDKLPFGTSEDNDLAK